VQYILIWFTIAFILPIAIYSLQVMQLHCLSSAWWSVPCLRPNTRKYRT